MKRKTRLLAIGLSLQLFYQPLLAGIRTVSISTASKYHAPRWMYEEGFKKKKGFVSHLINIKKNYQQNNYRLCLNEIKVANRLSKSLQPWLMVYSLKCASDMSHKFSRAFPELGAAIGAMKVNKQWLVVGPQKKILQESFVAALIVYFRQVLKTSRKQAWQAFDLIQQYKEWLSQEQRALVYKTAGELAFLQQKLLVAQDYLQRSLQEEESEVLREKLKAIKETLIKQNILPQDVILPTAVENHVIEASEKETQIYERMKAALTAGELVSAVEDAIDLINTFPAGIRAQEASQRLFTIYVNISRKKDRNYKILKNRLFKQMRKVNSDWHITWAQKLFDRSLYSDALNFSELYLEEFSHHKSYAKILMIAANSALFIGENKRAEQLYRETILKSAGSEEYFEALFKLGLLLYKKEKYSESAAHFEKLLAITSKSNFDLKSRYWLWRDLQKIDLERAEKAADSLIQKYPLTYYGLRALSEKNNNALKWKQRLSEPITIDLKLTDSEFLAWERFNILLQAGWFKEAQAELLVLPSPQTAREKAVFASLWFAAFDHFRATSLMQQAWELDPRLFTLELIRLIYPKEFEIYIRRDAKLRQLEPLLVTSLIKQESSFRTEAVSPAGALGLMQLMPTTARGVAERIRWKGLDLPEQLFNADVNIKFGTSYLAQMLRAFNGHVPLSLAAYNAGIGRIRRWLGLRTNLVELSETHSSDPKLEIWIDELPWEETSFYVKAILRNLMLYRMLDQGESKISNPIWVDATKVQE